MSQPNVLLILTDQQTATSLRAYGNTICRTPNIDRLAEAGTCFTNAYCTTPICSPARASLQTGLYPHKHGVQSNIYTRGCMVHELPDHPTLLSRRLQSLGYSTGYTGKWHMGFGDDKHDHPEYIEHIHACPVLDRVSLKGSLPSSVGYEGDGFPGHGGIGVDTPQFHDYLKAHGLSFQRKVIFEKYPQTFEVTSGTRSTVSHFLTENAMGHIQRFIDRKRPWFYMLNYWGPHAPYHASSEFVDLYRNTELPEWVSFREDLSSKPQIHNAHRTETTAKWTWAEFQTATRYYYASITEIDSKIGMLLKVLEGAGQLDNTLIIFSSDHGDSLGIHRGLTDKSLFMYEEINRIPLIVRLPGGKRVKASETAFAGTCDIYSTILDFAGLERAQCEMDGRSMRPLLEAESAPWRDCIVTESVGIDYLLFTQRALRWGCYKYVFNSGDLDELYDLSLDPHELKNLINDAASGDLLRQMRLKLDAWMGEMNDGLRERYRRLRLRELHT